LLTAPGPSDDVPRSAHATPGDRPPSTHRPPRASVNGSVRSGSRRRWLDPRTRAPSSFGAQRVPRPGVAPRRRSDASIFAVDSWTMRMLDDRDAPPRGARGSGTIRRAVSLASLLLLAAAAGCGRDAPLPAPAAADSAAVDSTTARAEVAPPQSEPETPQPVLPPPEPPAPETTWVRLAHLESDSRPRVRRRTFRSDTGQFRVIVELRESTTTFNQGRVRA